MNELTITTQKGFELYVPIKRKNSIQKNMKVLEEQVQKLNYCLKELDKKETLNNIELGRLKSLLTYVLDDLEFSEERLSESLLEYIF
ncbi:hypothetical protein N9L07_01390 [Flavobacteriaceae bacterium]|nr:hypothetical protein [Flavobacteriaceae bacterium]